MTKAPTKGPLSAEALERIRASISYDPDTGTIRRLTAAMQAVTTKTAKGYILVGVIGRRMYGHRLAWALHYGEWPSEQIDHINGNRCDNRICNLRHVSHAENLYNSKVRKHSTTGIKGVKLTPVGRWAASVRFKNKQIHIGTFDTAEEAEQARIAKERELGIDGFVRPTGVVVGTAS